MMLGDINRWFYLCLAGDKKNYSNFFLIGTKEIKGEQCCILMPSRLQTFPSTSPAGLFVKLAPTYMANQLRSHLNPF
jgi:hypothetical protein